MCQRMSLSCNNIRVANDKITTNCHVAAIGNILSHSLSLLVVLFVLHADINDLQDVVVCTELQGTNVYLDIVPQEVFSKLPNLLRPGCAPHQGLSVRLRDRNPRKRKHTTQKHFYTENSRLPYEMQSWYLSLSPTLICSTILRICGSKPMSSMRSASSSTR